MTTIESIMDLPAPASAEEAVRRQFDLQLLQIEAHADLDPSWSTNPPSRLILKILHIVSLDIGGKLAALEAGNLPAAERVQLALDCADLANTSAFLLARILPLPGAPGAS